MDDSYELRDGTVLEARPGSLLIRMEKAADDCGGCHSCSLKKLCIDRSAGFIDIRVPTAPASPPQQIGNRVRLAYRRANPALAAAILFLPALAGLFFGGFLVNHFFGVGDLRFLAGAVLGMAAGLACTFIINRIFRATAPVIKLVETAVP